MQCIQYVVSADIATVYCTALHCYALLCCKLCALELSGTAHSDASVHVAC